VPPSNTVAPAISGTPQQGDQLTVSDGTWTGDTPMTFSYAWSDGQSGKTITLGSGDVGQTITATVTATNDACPCTKNTATSAGVGPVTASGGGGGLQSMAYWLGWEPGTFSEANLPWADLTQVAMFSLEVENGPGLNVDQNLLNEYNMPAWTAMLHSHGVKALITIGDNTGGGGGSWGTACNATNQAGFVSNLVNYATTNGFDGIDIDDEDGSQSLSQLEGCVQAITTAAHAAGLTVSSDDDQSIYNSNPYAQNSADASFLDQVEFEFYGYDPANNWNCGTGTPFGTCAFVTQEDKGALGSGIPASKVLLGMATCCGAAQAGYSNLATTGGVVDTSGTVTSIPLGTALTSALPAGDVVLASTGTPPAHYEVFTTSGAASGATAIPITGTVRGSGSFAFPSGSNVQSAYAGPWDCYNLAQYAQAHGMGGSMEFDLQDDYSDYGGSFPCLDQIALGLGLTH